MYDGTRPESGDRSDKAAINFRTTLQQLVSAFVDEGIGYALIGGYAVGLWGVARGTVDIDFLVLRDLIGMKIQAMANDPARTAVGRYDIEEMMRLHGPTLDWQLIEEYFDLFQMGELFLELKAKHAPQ